MRRWHRRDMASDMASGVASDMASGVASDRPLPSVIGVLGGRRARLLATEPFPLGGFADHPAQPGFERQAGSGGGLGGGGDRVRRYAVHSPGPAEFGLGFGRLAARCLCHGLS